MPSVANRGESSGGGYIPETASDYELGSEVVRHAEPVDDDHATAATYSRDAESAYVSLVKGSGGPAGEPIAPIDTVSSSVNISYDADDLEVPAFLRKRGDS